MNQLKMDIQETISALSRGGWSQRRIARELGLDRETVARYRRLARQAEAPKPAIPPAGSELVQTPNPAIVPPPAPRSRRHRIALQSSRQIQPFRPPGPSLGASVTASLSRTSFKRV